MTKDEMTFFVGKLMDLGFTFDEVAFLIPAFKPTHFNVLGLDKFADKDAENVAADKEKKDKDRENNGNGNGGVRNNRRNNQ